MNSALPLLKMNQFSAVWGLVATGVILICFRPSGGAILASKRAFRHRRAEANVALPTRDTREERRTATLWARHAARMATRRCRRPLVPARGRRTVAHVSRGGRHNAIHGGVMRRGSNCRNLGPSRGSCISMIKELLIWSLFLIINIHD